MSIKQYLLTLADHSPQEAIAVADRWLHALRELQYAGTPGEVNSIAPLIRRVGDAHRAIEEKHPDVFEGTDYSIADRESWANRTE